MFEAVPWIGSVILSSRKNLRFICGNLRGFFLLIASLLSRVRLVADRQDALSCDLRKKGYSLLYG